MTDLVDLTIDNPRWKIYENIAWIDWSKLDGIEESLKIVKAEYEKACELTRGPVLLTVKEAREMGGLPQEYRSARFTRFLRHLDRPELVGADYKSMSGTQEGSDLFQVPKQYYLIHDIAENGVWSPPNAALRKYDSYGREVPAQLHFHPGPNRMEAICRNNLEDQEILVWDKYDYYGKESLTFSQWFQLWCAPTSFPWFSKVTKFGNHPDEVFMVEGHVNQGVTAFKEKLFFLQDLFRGVKPRIYGIKETEKLTEYVSFSGETNVSIHVKDDSKEFNTDDLDILYYITEDNPNPENDILSVEVKELYK